MQSNWTTALSFKFRARRWSTRDRLVQFVESETVKPLSRWPIEMTDSSKTVTADDLTEYLADACLRLVLSIDLAGATAFKKLPEVDDENPWIIAFEQFYAAFPIELTKAYELAMPAYCSVPPFSTTSRFRVLKILGDEIIFSVELHRHQQAVYHLHAAMAAVKSINEKLAATYRLLQCKPTAWLAGFPVVNSEISMSDSSSSPDYIGPSMDIGFRLARLSSPRKFVVSFDLAQMLSHALNDVSEIEGKPRFYFDGNEALHGVLNEIPYPIIWMDLFESIPLDERLRGIERKACSLTDVWTFCEAFRKKNGIWRWFIKGDSDPLYRGPDHADYDGSRDAWLERYRSIVAKRRAASREWNSR